MKNHYLHRRIAFRLSAGAMAAARALVNSNLFQGQSDRFFRTLHTLASAADAAHRHF